MAARDIRKIAVSIVLVAALVVCFPLALDADSSDSLEASALPSELKIGYMQSIDSLNPFIGLNDASYVFYGLVYDTLTCLGNDLEIVPNLATSWWAVPSGADSDPRLVGMPYGSVWQFNLSQSALWSDGVPFSADDVVYNIWLNSAPPHYDSMWAYQPYTWGMHEAWKIDDFTVRISFWDRNTLEPTPAAYAPLISIPMLPKHLMEQLPGGFSYIGMNWTGTFPESISPGMPIVGTGPFTATSAIYNDWIAGDHITLVRNPNCHWASDYGKSVHFDMLTMRFFWDSTSMVLGLKAGEIDAASYGPTAYDAIKNDVESGNLQNVAWFDGPKITQYFTEVAFCMNNAGPNPSRLDPVIRQALHMASNKSYMTNNMYLGYADVGSTLIPPVNSFWHYEPTAGEKFTYDLTAAASLLEANGYIDIDADGLRECTISSKAVQMGWGSEGTDLSYQMLVRKEYPEEKDMAQYLKTQWEQIGVMVQYLVVEELTLAAMVYSYNYDTVIWYWTADIDPNYILFTQSRNAWYGWSDNKYYNPAFDQNYTLSVRELNKSVRKSYVDNCQRIHYSDSPYIILAYPDQTYAWRTDSFTGWGDWAADPGRSLDNYWSGNPLFFDLMPSGGTPSNAVPTIVALAVDPNPVARQSEVSLIVTARDQDADALDFTVEFGDGRSGKVRGTESISQTVIFRHSYRSTGIYDITVKVDDGYPDANHTVSKTFSDRVLVGPAEWLEASIAPSAASVPTHGSVMFSASLSWNGAALSGSALRYHWNLSSPVLGSLYYVSAGTVRFTAGSTPGSGSIICQVDYYEATASAFAGITIIPPNYDRIVVTPPTASVRVNSPRMFTAVAYDSAGNPINNVSIIWSVQGLNSWEYSLDAWNGSCVNITGFVVGNATLSAIGTFGGVTKIGSAQISFVAALGPRSVDYEWWDMFNVPFGDWWNVRWPIYHSDLILSDSYPYILRSYEYPLDNHYVDYASMRLNITGRNMTELNMNSRPEFLPFFGTERGGTAVIDWYMQYLTTEEIQARYPNFASQNDGWIISLNGTVMMDEQAAKGVIGLTDPGFDSFPSWWSANEASVTEDYCSWLVYEAEERLDIENAYESYFQLFTVVLDAYRVGDQIVMSYEIVTWGMEALMMRWLRDAFMPTEWWYEDMNFHATIGPDSASVDIKTVVTYAVYAYETTESMGEPAGVPCWTWEPRLADAVASTMAHPYSALDPYLPFSYLTRSPVSPRYGTYIQYDYVPACWNLTDNETLRFRWPAGDQLFRYRTEQGLVVNVTSEMIVDYSEPGPADFPGKIAINTTGRTIEFKGPINMWEWSSSQTAHTFLADEWIRLGGDLVPYGQPLIEFKAKEPIQQWLDHIRIEIADSVPAGDLVTFTVTALNNWGDTYRAFNGTVNFTSTDHAALLPANYTFTTMDFGVHTFVSALSFWTEGAQTLTVWNVSGTPVESGQASVTVLPKRTAGSFEIEVYHMPAVGVPEDVTVTVIDQYGDLLVNYTGTVGFTTNRTGEVTLPLDYTFSLSDAGVHTLPGQLVFHATGWFTLSVHDTSNPAASGSQTGIWVVPSPEVIDHFVVSGIRNMLTLQKSDVLVTAYDQYGYVFERYTGTIHFSADKPGGIFPPDYTFLASDHGFKKFTKTVSFTEPANYTVFVSDTVVTTAVGLQANIFISYRPMTETFRMYDMFQEPWGQWWPWRYPGYKSDIVLNNETGKYTMIYNPDTRGNQGIIYAPYRWNITGVNMTQVSVHNPEFMPVLGTPDVPGAEASIDVYFQYLDWNWWNSYWKPYWNFPDAIMIGQTTDGWNPGVVYEVTMNRAAAEEWLGIPQTANPLTWWAINGGQYLQSWSAWIMNEGNVRLDIWAGYEWPFVDVGTKMKLQVLQDGRIVLQIGSIAWGYEILMTRWLSETDLCRHEAYYEDMSLHADYYSDWMDFTFDAVCQYSLRAVKANESLTNEPAWAWEPLLIDYVATWNTPGGTHPSMFDPWANLTYQSWNAGDPRFGTEVPYDSGKSYFNLTKDQTFIIELPLGDDILGYYAQAMPTDSIRRIIRGDPGKYDPYPRGLGARYNYTAYWPIMMNGTMTLGWYGYWTDPPDLDECYDRITNTITMVGPMNFDNSHHANGALYSGAPWIEFNVTPASSLPPIAIANAYPNPANVSDAVTLDGSSSFDPTGNITDYAWTFIYDGSPVELHGMIVQHVFLIGGTYQITLTCVDDDGNNDSASLSLTVTQPVTFNLTLVPGWNFVSVPPVGNGYRASTLGLQINDIVVRWHPPSQSYPDVFVVGVSLPFKDFDILPSTGYWIFTGTAKTLHLFGTIPTGTQSLVVTVPAMGGWATVGLNSLRTDMRASDLVANYTGGSIVQVVRYTPGYGYSMYNPLVPFTDFLLVPGQAYWIYVTGSGTLTYAP